MLSDFKISDRCANGWTEFPATGKFTVLMKCFFNLDYCCRQFGVNK